MSCRTALSVLIVPLFSLGFPDIASVDSLSINQFLNPKTMPEVWEDHIAWIRPYFVRRLRDLPDKSATIE